MSTPAAKAPMPPNTIHSVPVIWAPFTPAGLPAASGSAQAEEATMLITITNVLKVRIWPPGRFLFFVPNSALAALPKQEEKHDGLSGCRKCGSKSSAATANRSGRQPGADAKQPLGG